jgi:hypothetical protein
MIKIILGIVVVICLWQAYQLRVLKSDVAEAKVALFIQQGQIYNLKQQLLTAEQPVVKVINVSQSELDGFSETSEYIVNTISKNSY